MRCISFRRTNLKTSSIYYLELYLRLRISLSTNKKYAGRSLNKRFPFLVLRPTSTFGLIDQRFTVGAHYLTTVIKKIVLFNKLTSSYLISQVQFRRIRSPNSISASIVGDDLPELVPLQSVYKWPEAIDRIVNRFNRIKTSILLWLRNRWLQYKRSTRSFA